MRSLRPLLENSVVFNKENISYCVPIESWYFEV